jgi:hypothetical protein
MVIETFRAGCRDAVYERLRRKGRMLPAGLVYRDSWLETEGDRCFQLMETGNPTLLREWSDCWSDLVSFEFIELRKKP